MLKKKRPKVSGEKQKMPVSELYYPWNSPPSTIKYRGETYHFFRAHFTMRTVKKDAKKAYDKGYNVHIVKQSLLPGGLIYTSPRIRGVL